MSEYLTIKAFADLAGVSSQAIYQRLNKDLKKYLKVIEGKKMLSSEALTEFGINKVDKKVEKEIDNEFARSLQDTLIVLTEQLKVKDQQIADLNERLNQALKLNENNQVLLLDKQTKELPEPEESTGFWSKFMKRGN